MATLDVYSLENKKVGSVEVGDALVLAEIKPYLLTEMVNWQRAKMRRGTQSAKTKAEVSGTNKKPFPQKGRGNARQGSLRNPHQVGGGVAFAPKTRDYSYAMPKAKRRAALAVALSARQKEGGLKVVESWELPAAKTKVAASALAALGVDKALVVDSENVGLRRSMMNLVDAKYLESKALNVMDILRYPNLIVSKQALLSVNEKLVGEISAEEQGE